MEKELFEELVNSMAEMVAIGKGELVPASENIHHHVLPDVKAIRKEVGMKQAEFSDAMGLNVDLVSNWELQTGIINSIKNIDN